MTAQTAKALEEGMLYARALIKNVGGIGIMPLLYDAADTLGEYLIWGYLGFEGGNGNMQAISRRVSADVVNAHRALGYVINAVNAKYDKNDPRYNGAMSEIDKLISVLASANKDGIEKNASLRAYRKLNSAGLIDESENVHVYTNAMTTINPKMLEIPKHESTHFLPFETDKNSIINNNKGRENLIL